MSDQQQSINKSDPDKYKAGDWFCFTSYCNVKNLRAPDKSDSFSIETLDKQNWTVSKSIVKKTAWSTDQYDREEHVTRSELEEKLEHAGDTVFCVHFTKKPDHIKIEEQLAEQLDKGELNTQRKRRKLCKSFLEGEARTLHGFLKSSHPKLGYYKVHDLEKGEERQVNGRSLKWMIFKGVKYTTEKKN